MPADGDRERGEEIRDTSVEREERGTAYRKIELSLSLLSPPPGVRKAKMTPVQRPERERAKEGEGTWEKGNYFSLYNYTINFLTLERSGLTPQTSSSLRSVSIPPGRQRRTEGRSQKRDGQKGEGRKMQQVKKREEEDFLSVVGECARG